MGYGLWVMGYGLWVMGYAKLSGGPSPAINPPHFSLLFTLRHLIDRVFRQFNHQVFIGNDYLATQP